MRSSTLLLCFLTALGFVAAATFYKPTVYQKIRQSPKLSVFFSLLENNRPAKLNLQYGEMTVFVPNDEAFEWYSAGNFDNLIGYHMAWYAKQIKDLQTGALSAVLEESPPLWITRLDDHVFINNARIVPELSDYRSEINDKPKKSQALHVIDQVLDPVIKRDSFGIYNPSTLDVMSNSKFWDLGSHKVGIFYRKILENRKEALYKSEGNFTFFIPVDEGFTDHRAQMLDDGVIDAHIIPARVLFTRPTPKDTPFETIANGDFLYVVLLMSSGEGNVYVKSHTLIGDANHPTGEIASEIVKANIPVSNGVVHLIKRPLAVFDRKLTFFPLLPIKDKLSMDPELQFTYALGEETGFNSLFDHRTTKFTYFIPRDRGWRNLENFMEINNTLLHKFIFKYGKSILSRHVIAGNTSYTIEDLRQRAKVPDTADVDLSTIGGVLKIGIGKSDGSYMIYWRNKIMKVHRPDYYCANGIVHIVDDVFMNEEDVGDAEEDDDGPNSLHILNLLMRITL